MATLGSVTCPNCGGQARVVATGEHLVEVGGRRQLVVDLDVDCACPHNDPVEVVAAVDPAPKRQRKRAAKKNVARAAKKSAAKKSTAKKSAARKAAPRKATKR